MLIKKVSLNDAKKIWDYSGESNSFNNPIYMHFLNKNTIFYGCYSNNLLNAVWPIYILNRKKLESIVPFNFYFLQPFFEKTISYKPLHSKINLVKEIYLTYLKFFEKKKYKINFNFHWKSDDVKYLIWLQKNISYKLEYELKFSAILHAKEIKKQNWRYLRRRSLKKFYKNDYDKSIKIVLNPSVDLKEYLKIIKENIPKSEFLKHESSYYSSLKLGYKFGRYIVFFKDKKILGFSLIFKDNFSYNMMYNFVNKEWKNKNLMVYLYETLFEDFKKSKLDYFDFNGANSFKGAEEKSTYGSRPKIYFSCKIKF